MTIPSTRPAAQVEPSLSDRVAALIELCRHARSIVAFTGAGISTESGIPDYRGPGGVWERNAPPTMGDFRANPETRRAYWAQRRSGYLDLVAAEPNAGHRALVALERQGRLLGIVTQNIDGLHQKAGSDPELVVELHGTSHKVRCLDCGRIRPATDFQAALERGTAEPRCDACGGPLRSATVLFGEPLPVEALRRAGRMAQNADLMLIVGSSLVVQPAAQLPIVAKEHGAKLAIVNRLPTPLDPIADVLVAADAGPTLAAAAAALAAERSR